MLIHVKHYQLLPVLTDITNCYAMGNSYVKHRVSYYYVAILSRQIPMLLQDTTPYVVTEIWENTLPLFNLEQYYARMKNDITTAIIYAPHGHCNDADDK